MTSEINNVDALLSNQKTTRVCQWIKANNRFPSIKSTDQIESRMARFIVNRMRARDHRGTMVWYESDQETATSLGFPDLFMSHFERDSNKKVHELCQWIKINNRIPSVKSSDPAEVILSRFMTAKRSAGRVGTAALYDSDKAIAHSYGMDSVFELSQEKESNKKTQELCDWIKAHGHNPDDRSLDPVEAVLGRFWEYKKGVNRDTIYNSEKRPKGVIYDSDVQIATAAGFPYLFKIYSNEERSNIRTHELCGWIMINKKTPKNNPNDPVEHRRSVTLYRLRRNFNKNDAFDSDIAIINSYGLNGLNKLKTWKKNALYLQWKNEKSN